MIRVAVIGDFHIPWRKDSIPGRVLSLLEDWAPHLILCTGDYSDEKIVDILEEISPLVSVRGEVDYVDFPAEEIVDIYEIKFLVVHRELSLPYIVYKKPVDVIIYGHTHIPSLRTIVVENKPILVLNPGSATGASESTPSLALLAVEKNCVKVRIYQILSKDTLRFLNHCYLKVTSW